MAAAMEWILAHLTAEGILWFLYGLLLALLLSPVAYFLRFGWWRRKQEFLNSMSDVAAASYFRAFHASEYPEISRQVDDWAKQVKQAAAPAVAPAPAPAFTAAVPAAPAPAAAAPAPAPAPAQPVVPAATAVAVAHAAAMRQHYKQSLSGTRDRFADFFDSEFGRSRFIIPAVLLVLLASGLLYLCVLGGLRWFRQGAFEGPDVRLDVLIGILQGWGFSADILAPIRPVPAAIVLAILGGFTWVTYDLIDRAGRDEINPVDLVWSSFRLVVAVPAAFAISFVFNKDLALPIAYLLGTLPTGTLFMLGRRALGKAIGDPDAPRDGLSQVQNLTSVDTTVAARLAAEGITTFSQLAYGDPVRLSIRTGLNFSVVIGLASEAMLGLYLVKKERLEAARLFGLCGSYECANLWDALEGPAGPARTRAEKIVKDLAGLLKTPQQSEPSEEAVVNTLREIATDPYTNFLRECWGSNLE